MLTLHSMTLWYTIQAEPQSNTTRYKNSLSHISNAVTHMKALIWMHVLGVSRLYTAIYCHKLYTIYFKSHSQCHPLTDPGRWCELWSNQTSAEKEGVSLSLGFTFHMTQFKLKLQPTQQMAQWRSLDWCGTCKGVAWVWGSWREVGKKAYGITVESLGWCIKSLAWGWDLGSAKRFFLGGKKLFLITSESKVSPWSATSWSGSCGSSSPIMPMTVGLATQPE